MTTTTEKRTVVKLEVDPQASSELGERLDTLMNRLGADYQACTNQVLDRIEAMVSRIRELNDGGSVRSIKLYKTGLPAVYNGLRDALVLCGQSEADISSIVKKSG